MSTIPLSPGRRRSPRPGAAGQPRVPSHRARWRGFCALLGALVVPLLLSPAPVRAALLGIGPQIALPEIETTQIGGGTTYNVGTRRFVVTATPSFLRSDASTLVYFDLPPVVSGPPSLSLAATLGACSSASCSISGGAVDDFELSGQINIGGSLYSGVLLTGKVLGLGFSNVSTTDFFDARVEITGGTLSSVLPGYAPGQHIGLAWTAEQSTFTGTFDSNFSAGRTKMRLGPIPGGSQPNLIGDRVWEDRNGDGLQNCSDTNANGILGDAGDTGAECTAGLGGVPVALYPAPGGVCDTSGSPLATTTTDAAGFYAFQNRPEGDYCIKVTKPQAIGSCTDIEFTAKDAGSDDAADSDVNPATGVSGGVFLGAAAQVRTLDAGLYCKARLGDRLWDDSARPDGIQGDPTSEPGIPGQTVNLYRCAGPTDTAPSLVGTTTTDANGNYFFDVAPGLYSLEFIPPDDATFTLQEGLSGASRATGSDVDPQTGRTGCVIEIPSGAVDLDWDAGVIIPVPDIATKIGDRLWEDTNGNGIQDDNEPSVNGDEFPVQVRVYQNCGLPNESLLGPALDLDALGNYLKEIPLPAGGTGTFCVEFDRPGPGFCEFGDAAFTLRDQGSDNAQDSDVDPATGRTAPFTLTAGTDDLTWDAGVYCPAKLGDRVWDDSAQPDGIQGDEGTEPGIQGATVSLFECDALGGTPGTTPVQTTSTDADGWYEFLVTPGVAYALQFSAPATPAYAKYLFTRQNQGGDDALDSDVAPNGRTTCQILVPSNTRDPDWDAGLFLPIGSLGDKLFHDRNGNGIQDAGDEGVPGGSVELFANPTGGACQALAADRIGSATTGNDGEYAMINLPEGNYCLKFTPPAGFCPFGDLRISPRNRGGDPALDSDIDANGLTGNIVLPFNAQDLTWDAGIYCAARLGDRVWRDPDRDGVQDCADSGGDGLYGNAGDTGPECADQGVANVPVRLLAPGADGCHSGDETVLQNTLTNATGFYLFDNLEPGDYCVEIERPSGLDCTLPNIGQDEARDSDLVPLANNPAVCRSQDPTQDPIGLESQQDDRTWDGGLVPPAGPAIDLEKATNGEDADGPTGPVVALGSTVTWTYVITNTGNVALANVRLTDDRLGAVTCPKDSLAVGESMTCTRTGTATVAGQYVNVGTVTGIPVDGNGNPLPGVDPVTDVDPSHYFAADPKLDLEKATNGEDADTPTGPRLLVGSTVTWAYVVTNTGNTDLINLALVDDKLGTVTCPKTALAPGEAMTCTATGIASEGQYENTAEVTGLPAKGGLPVPGANPVRDQDPSHYFGVRPAIDVEKATNGQDADLPSGPVVTVGSTVTWTYVVTNTGNVDLVNVALTDDQVGAITCPKTALAIGEAMTCTATGVAVPGQYRNVATVTGRRADDPNGPPVSDEDPSHYVGQEPARASLGDRVWEDLNANGVQDDGEPGIPNVPVTLRSPGANGLCDATDAVIDTATTDGSGLYGFAGLAPGSYCVTFGQPAGFLLSPRQQGGNPAKDSDGLISDLVTLNPGQHDPTIDSGFYRLASLGNRAWEDQDGNGRQDVGEPGVPNVRISLTDPQGNVRTADTDANGLYGFTGLVPGVAYTVVCQLPMGYDFTTQGNGARDDDTDSNANPANGGMGTFVLASGEDLPTVDCGLVARTCDISVSNTCAIVQPQPTAGTGSCVKPIDLLKLEYAPAASAKTVASVQWYKGTVSSGALLGTRSGPLAAGTVLDLAGFGGSPNDVQVRINYTDGTATISQFHISCSDADMNGPEDCGKPAGDGKDNSLPAGNVWLFRGTRTTGGAGIVCPVASDPTFPTQDLACKFEAPAEAASCSALKPVTELTMIWDGPDGVNFRTALGQTINGVNNGDVVKFNTTGSGNDFVVNITGAITGRSELHISCSDDTMNGPEDCGSAQGNNKTNSASLVNLFRFGGMKGQNGEFGCPGTPASTAGANVAFGIRVDNPNSAPMTVRIVDQLLGIDRTETIAANGFFQTVAGPTYINPDGSNLFETTVTATGNVNGAVCAASDSVRVVRKQALVPMTCSDIKPLRTLSMVWNGSRPVNVVTQFGETFRGVAPGNQITFSVAGGPNDFAVNLYDAENGAALGQSVFHISCSDDTMNGTEDCGSAQGNNKGNLATLINQWLFDGMGGSTGSFACDLDNTGVVYPVNGGGGSTAAVVGASQADLGDLRKFKWSITNQTGADVFLTGMAVVWPDGPNGQGRLSKVKLGRDEIARDVRDAVSPTVLPAEKAFEPDQNRRKLKKGETKVLEIEFTTESYFRDQDDFQVQLTFSNGQVLTFAPTPTAVTGATTLDFGDDRKVRWALTNDTTAPLLITDVQVVWPSAHRRLRKMKLAADFAKDVNDASSPTQVPLEKAFTANVTDRRLLPGERRNLEIEFETGVKGRTGSQFSIRVTFSNGDVVTFN